MRLSSPLILNNNNIYPQTSADQIVRADGTMLEDENGLINSDTLDGKDSSYFATTKEVDVLDNKIPFSFGIDSDGNYGYIKAGADTVTPFKRDAYDVIYVVTDTVSSNYTTRTGYVYPFYKNRLITYSTNNVSWSASATTTYIKFTTEEKELDIIFGINIQHGTKCVCTPYITGANYTIIDGNMLTTGTAGNCYYHAEYRQFMQCIRCGTSYCRVIQPRRSARIPHLRARRHCGKSRILV